MKRIPSTRLTLSALAAAALLAACGGSGEALVPGTSIPLAATTDAAQAAKFVNETPQKTSNTAEPLEVEGVKFATSETAEPEPI